MVKITFELDSKLNDRFRKVIATNKGLYRGAIQEAITEAVNDWIKKMKSTKKKLNKEQQNETISI